MTVQKQITAQRQRRAYRVRNVVRAAGRLRLSVHRTNHHIYAQIIDDAAGKTLVAAGTTEAVFRSKSKFGGNAEAAAAVGKLLAERAVQQGITEVAFDRGHFRYHGRIAALADAARAGGLSF